MVKSHSSVKKNRHRLEKIHSAMDKKIQEKEKSEGSIIL